MGRCAAVLVVCLLGSLSAVSCSDRSVDEDYEPPPIERLCRDNCERAMECPPEPNFSSMQECERSCRDSHIWSTTCDWAQARRLECIARYDCPEFLEVQVATEGPCFEAFLELNSCVPGDPR